ncbi:DUF6161 domain-containing protein [Ferrovibrio sp.]|uniref:DUF6161 domain-containing protein n=1 Tax=Ferrovibrio sp. TaxID=1917215 RepID=UPI003D2C158C
MSEEDEGLSVSSAGSLVRREMERIAKLALQEKEQQQFFVNFKNEIENLKSELASSKRANNAEKIEKSRLIGEHQKEIKDLTEELAKSREEAAKSAASLLEHVEEATRLKTEIDALKVQHDAILKYEKAAQFWGEKARRHRMGSFIALAGFIVIGGTYTIFGLYSFANILSALPKNNSGEIGLSTVILVSAIVLPALWTLRLLARFSVENFSLGNDAEERRTMMETFLSLIGNPEAKIQGEERMLVLRSVFRPASASKDEGAPVAALEFVKSLGDSIKSK